MRISAAERVARMPERKAFCACVRGLMVERNVTMVQLGRALLTHRHLGGVESGETVAQRLLDGTRWDVRVTIDDLAAWERVLPGIVQCYLDAYRLPLDAVSHLDATAGASDTLRAVGGALGAAADLLSEATRALEDGTSTRALTAGRRNGTAR